MEEDVMKAVQSAHLVNPTVSRELAGNVEETCSFERSSSGLAEELSQQVGFKAGTARRWRTNLRRGLVRR